MTEDFDYRPLADRVYDEVRRQISDGVLAAHSHLVQERVAIELSVSRTPVREALSRLAQEGFVTQVPGFGYVVAKVREQAILDVQGARQVLEVAALRLALPNYTTGHLNRLRAVYQEMVDADLDTADYTDLTRRFHHILVEPCPNTLLLSFIAETWSLPLGTKVTGRYGDNATSVEVMIADHAEIIDAVAAGDRQRALDLLESHIAAVHSAGVMADSD